MQGASQSTPTEPEVRVRDEKDITLCKNSTCVSIRTLNSHDITQNDMTSIRIARSLSNRAPTRIEVPTASSLVQGLSHTPRTAAALSHSHQPPAGRKALPLVARGTFVVPPPRRRFVPVPVMLQCLGRWVRENDECFGCGCDGSKKCVWEGVGSR